MKNIYLDNGATTMVAKEVTKAMLPYFTEKYGNASSLHSLGQEAKEALEEAREVIAKSINADPSEIIFTSGGTESDNIAIQATVNMCVKKGNHIITSKIEHPAVQKTCNFLEHKGFKVTYIDVDKDGIIDPKKLEKAITKETVLVTIMHANNEIGTIQPIEEIGKLCKKHDIIFHTDAVQSYMKVPIDVKKQDIDMLSLSAHKIHGPKGIGALYIRKGTKICPLSYGGSHEAGIRPGTENIPGAVGFAEAVKLHKDSDNKKMTQHRDKLIKNILEIPESRLNGHKTKRLSNNVNITFNYIEGESLLLYLDEKGIAVSTGSACSSHSLEPSHVLTAIGLKPEESHGSIRITLSRYNTEEEINYTIEELKKVVEELRKLSPLGKK